MTRSRVRRLRRHRNVRTSAKRVVQGAAAGQRLTAAFGVLVGLLGLVLGTALWISREINDRSNATFIGTVIPLRTSIRNAEVAMLNQETGVRGFLATGQRSSLKPYFLGRRDVRRALEVVRDHIDNQPQLRDLVDTEADQVAQLETYFAQQIALASQGQSGLAAARLRIDDGEAAFDRFRTTASALDAARERLTSRAVRDQNRLTNKLTFILIVLGGSAIAIAIALAVRLPRRVGSLMRDLAHERDRATASRIAAEQRDAKSRFLADLSRTLDETQGARERLRRAIEAVGAAFTAPAAVADVQGDAIVVSGIGEDEDPAARAALAATLASAGPNGLGALIRRVVDHGQSDLAAVAAAAGTAGADHDPLPRPDTREAIDVVAVPLRALGSSAVLLVGPPAADGVLGGPDLAFVEEIAVRIGLAVENARLLEEQRSIARTLQEGLLPTELPEIPGMDIAARYRPASPHAAVGGDFYDVYRAGDGWCIVVGDVCGKGPDAAQLTGLARHTLRTAAVMDPAASPGQLLQILNRAMLDHSPAGDFCTAICARLTISPEHGRSLRLATGGHPPPLLRRSNGSIVDLAARGSLIGVFPDATFDEMTTDIADGDTVLWYTDGALEARRGRQLFGLERLRATLAGSGHRDAESVVRVVEDASVAFSDDRELQDDLVLVALRAVAAVRRGQ